MGLRTDRRGTGDMNETLAALIVIMTCVGFVMAAVHSASAGAAERAADERARAQGEVCLDAIARDPALAAGASAVSMDKARLVGAGLAPLSFTPAAMKLVTLRAARGGSEVWVHGNGTALVPGIVLVERPVAVEIEGGATVPGILRVGVVVA